MRELESELEEALDGLKHKNSDFPFGMCVVTSRVLSMRFGFLSVHGVYFGKMDELYRMHRSESSCVSNPQIPDFCFHVMNYDPRRKLYIDATMFQFDQSLPRILLMNESDPRLTTDGIKTRRSIYHVRGFFQNSEWNPPELLPQRFRSVALVDSK